MNDMNDAIFKRAGDAMADGMARICRLYGVSPLAGRVYAALFVSALPVSLESLSAAVGVAKSTTSVVLRKLEAARVVRRLAPRPDRRDFYEIIGDPWSVFADWTRLYFRPELEMFIQTSQTVLDALDGLDSLDGRDAGKLGGAAKPLKAGAPEVPRPEERAALRQRMDQWREFARLIAGLLGGVQPRAAERRPARRIPITIEDAP